LGICALPAGHSWPAWDLHKVTMTASPAQHGGAVH